MEGTETPTDALLLACYKISKSLIMYTFDNNGIDRASRDRLSSGDSLFPLDEQRTSASLIRAGAGALDELRSRNGAPGAVRRHLQFEVFS